MTTDIRNKVSGKLVTGQWSFWIDRGGTFTDVIGRKWIFRRHAKQPPHGFESYAKRLAKRYRGCPQLLEDVLDGLFHIAKADGVVSGDEIAYLERVSALFGLNPLTFQRLRAVHLGARPGDPYVVLNVPQDASDEVVRSAWRRALSDAHPDRVLARGLPAEFVEVAQAKASAINAAYDTITRDRGTRVAAVLD